MLKLTLARTSDVGGGAVPDTQVHDLANIPLRWMVREVMQAQCGVQFDEEALVRASIPRYNFLIRPTDPKDEQLALDAADVLEPIHDELKLDPLWWLLEIVPTHYSWQDDKGVWHKQFRYVLCVDCFDFRDFTSAYLDVTSEKAARFQQDSPSSM